MSKKNAKRVEETENVVKFAYLRDERDPRRVMTIARRWGKKNNKIHYAYTVCHPTADQFRKATGRALSTWRLNESPTKISPFIGEYLLKAVVADIHDRADTPSNVKSMTAQWLLENERHDEDLFLKQHELVAGVGNSDEDEDEDGSGEWDDDGGEWDEDPVDCSTNTEVSDDLLDVIMQRLVTNNALIESLAAKIADDTDRRVRLEALMTEKTGDTMPNGGCAMSYGEPATSPQSTLID